MTAKKKAVVVKSLTKSFRIPLESSSGVKQKLINLLKGINGYRVFTPLNDISFEIEEGDFFGIVGRNGSGKSTLLKTIAGIYTPEEGSVKVNGSLVPFIELGVGFNPELTGRENVYLNGALLGFSHKEMEGMYREIVDFAELEEFMDEKLKNYSSGMQVRLAFSIAIQAKGDILLLDEVLAVGDEAFQRKCFNYFAELKRDKKTVVLVTHDMDTVQRYCTKAMMIDKGKVLYAGSPADTAQKYRRLFIEELRASENITSNEGAEEAAPGGVVAIEADYKIDTHTNSIFFTVEVASSVYIEDAVITFEMIKDDGASVYRWVSDERVNSKVNLVKGSPIVINLELENIFPNSKYTVQVGVKKRDRSYTYELLPEALSLNLVYEGLSSMGERWRPKERFSMSDTEVKGE